MEEKAGVVIIGGGVVGCSTAYHLAKRGFTDVVVLEKELIGSGSTSKAAGGVRHQFSSEVNIRLSLYSIAAFQRFQEELGVDPLLVQHGYLFIATEEAELQGLREAVALQNRLGVLSRIVGPDEIQKLVPPLDVSHLIGGSYCPTDGRAGPHEVTHGYAAAAKRMGVKFHEFTAVNGVLVEKGRVQAVATDRGVIRTEWVVNAAGAYAGLIGQMAGVDVAVKPWRRQLFVTSPFNDLAADAPMTLEMETAFHFRREGPGVMIGLKDPDEPSSFNTNVNWDFMPNVVERALYWLPSLESAQIVTGWAGLYEETDDHHPIIAESRDLKGLIVASGFSGHGFMHSPATGLLVSEMVLDGRAHTIDVSQLYLERFAERKPVPGVHFI